MTTENENDPRDIDVLLHMSSFQDMTDEEIQMVIDKRREFAYQEGANSVDDSLYQEHTQKILANSEAAAARAEAAFNAAIESSVVFQEVSFNG